MTSTKLKIPLLDLSPEIDLLWEELNTAIQATLRSGQFIMGPQVSALERNIADYLGSKHAIALNSGTDALVIALRALRIGPGDEVITSAFSFFATAEAISLIGATPVFIDIDPDTFNLDVRLIEKKITKHTKAILPVHLYGHAADMDTITALASSYNLKVIEDTAQAFGGEYKGRKLGTIGDFGAFSFFPSKTLGAYGDAGMLITNQDDLANVARMLRTHGSQKKYYNEVVGYNSRMDSLQAAILQVKLPYIEVWTKARRECALNYNRLLADQIDVVLPKEMPYARHVYHQYTIRLPKRDLVQQYLAGNGVSTAVYYPVPLHKLPIYAHISLSLPVVEQAAKEVLSLPNWPQMSLDVQQQVVQTISAALKAIKHDISL